MRKSEIMTSILTLFLGATGLFTPEIRNLIFTIDWRIWSFILSIFFLFLTLLSICVRWLFNQNMKEQFGCIVKQKADLEKQKDIVIADIEKQKANEIKKREQIADIFILKTNIIQALFIEFFINEFERKNNTKKIAEKLYGITEDYRITIPQWEEFGVNENIIKEMRKIYHMKKIDNDKNK